jgi:hypothetical protein
MHQGPSDLRQVPPHPEELPNVQNKARENQVTFPVKSSGMNRVGQA